jgi:hypothetical protein
MYIKFWLQELCQKDITLSDIMSIILKENNIKDEMISELKNINTRLFIKIRQDFRSLVFEEEVDDINIPLTIKRSPNYFKYFNREILHYLSKNPLSKRMEISFWRDDILVLFNSCEGISVIHYPIPPTTLNFIDIDKIIIDIVSNDVKALNFEILNFKN